MKNYVSILANQNLKCPAHSLIVNKSPLNPSLQSAALRAMIGTMRRATSAAMLSWSSMTTTGK
jgi:hypothetical protein|tara:strand:+ start:224 stop:412 length:189 start_codon:yes stop_codon:yes gene_type:complete